MRFFPLLFGLAGVLMAGCDQGSGPDPVTFDRTGMLTHYAQDLIRPAFDTLHADVQAWQKCIHALTDAPTPARLDSAQEAWKKAFLRWQQVNAFTFGPGEDFSGNLAENLGTFPVDTADTESRIAAGNTSFADFARDTRGFPGAEYLLFRVDDDNSFILNQLQQSANRRAYLRAVCDDVVTRVAAVRTAWNGSYAETFIQNNGTDAGSSTSQVYNSFVESFEALKNYKIGLPAGKRLPQTTPAPALVEGYYSGISLPAAEAHFQALVRLYRGKDATKGLMAYVQSVTGGPQLVEQTLAQIGAVEAAFDAVPPGRLSGTILTHPQPVDSLFTELQKQTRFFKSDMSSLLGIAITYASGDGD